MQPVLDQQKLKALVYYIEVVPNISLSHILFLIFQGSLELPAWNTRSSQEIFGVIERLAGE